MMPNNIYESTLHSCESKVNISLANQIKLVIVQLYVYITQKEYVPEINQYYIKWTVGKITKNIPKKLFEKYACSSNDTSLYFESSRFKIERNFIQIYKAGKFRSLYPGDEAAIIEIIDSFLNDCQKKIQSFRILINIYYIQINRIIKVYYYFMIIDEHIEDIKSIIISKRLKYLFNNPMCMKQIEAYWKIMATFFKLKQQHLNYKNQVTSKLWSDIQASKTLFLDLNLENNKLTLFVKQLQHRLKQHFSIFNFHKK